MMFTLPVKTVVEVNLHLGHGVLSVRGKVVTCDPHVGNGIEFTNISPEAAEDLILLLTAKRSAASQ